MWNRSRREFVKATAGAAAAGLGFLNHAAVAQVPGERPKRVGDVRVLNPQNRVPVSFIIDDSTCLVNLAHFAMPQFAEVWPDRREFQKPWQKTPREIPDAFVRRFGQWCHQQGVKGKYSIVPYPACVGWLDRDLPGWSHKDLQTSLELVRTLMLPDWDIHPEMVSHTWVINTKTGRPYEERSPRFTENWDWTTGKSADEIADYVAYALKILKNVDLPCEGITTPGGFASEALPQLAQATLHACRDVYQAEIPHYFRHTFTDGRSVAPRVEYASGLDGPDPKCVVSIIGCTGDHFGGWDGMSPGNADKLVSKDLKSGEMIGPIERGEPAIMCCHWPGIYSEGRETGFQVFQTAVERLRQRYNHLIWMKLSEIARYWAAKELTRIERHDAAVALTAPFACPRFTLSIAAPEKSAPKLHTADAPQSLSEVKKPLDLKPGTWLRDKSGVIVCFDLPKGGSRVELQAV